MSQNKAKKLVSEEILPQPVLDENIKILDWYRQYQETADIFKETVDILEQVDIALGRKKLYKQKSAVTTTFKLKPHDIPALTTQSYKI